MQAIILCYHKVGPSKEEGRRLNISPQRLRSHVAYFQRRRFRFVRAGDLASSWTSPLVCLTFDDAYWSTVEWGLPVLDSLGVPGSLYAVGSLVGRSSLWDPASPRPLASWSSLLDAQRRGHEIGNHSMDHPFLAKLPLEEQILQVAACDELLRAHGLSPASFCYPYGNADVSTVAAVRRGGYGVGLVLAKRIAVDTDDRLTLPRIVVGYSDALPMLLYKIYVRPRLRGRT